MGWSCSWVGVQGSTRAEVLGALGFVETDEMAEPGSGEAKWSASEVDDGWLIVFSENFDWGGPDRVRDLSALGPSVGLQFEDKVAMTSIACAAKDGVEIWRVSHVNGPGEPLVVTGDPPPTFEEIRREFAQKQAEDDDVDYFHEVPIETVKSVCGYRADDWEPPFTVVRQVGAAAESEPARGGGRRPGFLSRLLGGGR